MSSARTLGGTPFTLNLNVSDVDAVWARAIEHGPRVNVRPPISRTASGRARSSTRPDTAGRCRRDRHSDAREIAAAMAGYTVVIERTTEPTPAPAPTAPVELGYFTLGFTDTALASRFYRELFGWQTEQGHSGAEYAHVNNTQLPLGFTPDGVDSPPVLYFRVDDARGVRRPRSRARRHRRQRDDVRLRRQRGVRDDQGREFQLWQPAPGY